MKNKIKTANVFKLTTTLIAKIFLICLLFPHLTRPTGQAAKSQPVIVLPTNASYLESLAAKEIRRYLYQRTDKLLEIINSNGELPADIDLIVVAQKSCKIIEDLVANNLQLKSSLASLEPQQYQFKTLKFKNHRVVLITGADPLGTLYAAYRFIEHFGVRFYLHGDTIPDVKIPLQLPQLNEQGKPLFNLRGIQPFHDFPEGPDWWSIDDYKAVISQIAKMRMNFIGLHTYPQGNNGPEPTVWIGLPEDIESDGKVAFSYPASYANTNRSMWGYEPKKTGEFNFGGSLLFERDDFGPQVMSDMLPWPKTEEQSNELFNRLGSMLNEVFEYARTHGIKTCIGTETPLIIPTPVQEKLKRLGKIPSDITTVQELYEGIFQRITKTHPLDYYWFWTPEDWTWSGASEEQIRATEKDLLAAIAAAKKLQTSFTLATCGWVLGPPQDRSLFDRTLPEEMPFSCINRQVGKAPIDPSFADIKGRSKWAIPWLEDDQRLTSPQLWVGRMRKDAADALKYGCTGLMGIHWRTRILGPNVSALAQACWDQSKWIDIPLIEPPEFQQPILPIGSKIEDYPQNQIADTNDDPLYQNILQGTFLGYRFRVPNGKYTIKLQFCEPKQQAGSRIFSVKLQSRRVIDKLDIFAEVGVNKALDYTFNDIEVTDGILLVDFDSIVGRACIAAITVKGSDVDIKINSGGSEYKDYIADPDFVQLLQTFKPADDFYRDWAICEFGPEDAKQIAGIFTKLDGHLPEPSQWRTGPGAISVNKKPWQQVASNYTFVEDLEKLRPQIGGAGNLERFDYWLNNFRFMRSMAQVGCTLGQLDKVTEQINQQQDDSAKKKLAAGSALSARKQLIQQWAQMVNHLLAAVSSSAEMGTIANIEQHCMGKLQLLTGYDKSLEEILGEPLPAEAKPYKDYRGPDRLIVPTVRGTLMADENLNLKAIILSANQPKKVSLYWRPLGTGTYNAIPLAHIARGVYSVILPSEKITGGDLEYYIKATTADGKELYFPASAPQINQTVVVANKT